MVQGTRLQQQPASCSHPRFSPRSPLAVLLLRHLFKKRVAREQPSGSSSLSRTGVIFPATLLPHNSRLDPGF